MARDNYVVISDSYYSNCLIEAVKAKIRHPFIVKIYFCMPVRSFYGHRSFHMMWSDKSYSYDFSDLDYQENDNHWYRYLLYRGHIRRFSKDFARRYSSVRNKIARSRS